MNKKLVLIVYYTGLIAGILIMNILLMNHREYGDLLAESMQGMDKLQFINKKELFLYLFLKRIKQMGILCLLYTQISKLLTLYFADFYFALIEGLFLSLCTYYFGIGGIGKGSFLLLPQFLCFFLIQLVGWGVYENEKTISGINYFKLSIILIVALIVSILVEISVNFSINL